MSAKTPTARRGPPEWILYCLPILAALLAAECLGWALFWAKFGQTPRAFSDRHFYPAIRFYMTDHPYLPYLATPGEVGHIRFNSRGDRGPELETPKRRIRLLCYGGSTTFDGAHPWDKTWPGILQGLLGAERYEVVIAAQNGATTADSLVNFALVHQDSQADYVLTYEGINDLESSYAPGFRPDYAHRRRKIGDIPYPIFRRLPRWLDHSSLYTALRWKLIGPREDLHAQFSRPTRYDFKNGPFGLATFRRNLESLHAIARARGAILILGTAQYYQPWADAHFGREFGDGWRRGIDAENDIQRALARKLAGTFLADVAASFKPAPEHMSDFCHLTEAGNAFVARAFYKAVLRAEASRRNARRR